MHRIFNCLLGVWISLPRVWYFKRDFPIFKVAMNPLGVISLFVLLRITIIYIKEKVKPVSHVAAVNVYSCINGFHCKNLKWAFWFELTSQYKWFQFFMWTIRRALCTETDEISLHTCMISAMKQSLKMTEYYTVKNWQQLISLTLAIKVDKSSWFKLNWIRPRKTLTCCYVRSHWHGWVGQDQWKAI